MKFYEKVTEIVDKWQYTICDKCGNKIESEYCSYNAFEDDWFEMRTGKSYPDSGDITHYEMDLCEKCSLELLDNLKVLGYNVREERVWF